MLNAFDAAAAECTRALAAHPKAHLTYDAYTLRGCAMLACACHLTTRYPRAKPIRPEPISPRSKRTWISSRRSSRGCRPAYFSRTLLMATASIWTLLGALALWQHHIREQHKGLVAERCAHQIVEADLVAQAQDLVADLVRACGAGSPRRDIVGSDPAPPPM
jgi:hypothetical protein